MLIKKSDKNKFKEYLNSLSKRSIRVFRIGITIVISTPLFIVFCIGGYKVILDSKDNIPIGIRRSISKYR